jgi:ADP-ribose pyrophosphatase YjhB (NUDIX family)
MAEEFSAGGVVVRDDQVAVIVPVKRDAGGRPVLGLPKGHPEAGESAAEAATREVREETGLDVELRQDLGEVEYEDERRRGGRQHKRVAFFLFAHRGGSFDDHDHEIEEARWMSLAEAAEALTYSGEREMVQRARSILAADR